MDDTVKTEIKEREFANESRLSYYIVPDTVTAIGKEAFSQCFGLRKIYIPKSVKKIGNNAFYRCDRLEIFCEGEPAEGWVHGIVKEKVRYQTVTDEDDAFNFHRSSGSFSFTWVEREDETFQNWNPQDRPVHTNVSKEITSDWEKNAD